MLKFEVTYSLPQHHFVDFAFYIDGNIENLLNVNLACWRPGRYEIGNFAQNIQNVCVFDQEQQPLKCKKMGKDLWQIETKGNQKITIRYRYYAAVLNAGSSYLDENQLYLNPVNCFLFLKDRIDEEIQIQFIIPSDYQIATQLISTSKNTFIAPNFDTLADSPLIASASIKHIQYNVANSNFHLWFQGDVSLNESKILSDFEVFTKEQIMIFGDCECQDYHFLMQMLPYNFHHGVEHCNSSVNALGPGQKLMEAALYNDFIGLCSHELFHLWNVKRIRPKSMLPYNFEHENYSSLGYVYEGITTYYGDLVLLRSGLYSMAQYLIEVNAHLNKHFNNYGRYHHSLADSSTDTWLDGYSIGIPDRKVNIYSEGLLAALILDAHCINQTNAEFCMDDMLRSLYLDYYKKGYGYDEEIWKACIENLTGHRYDWYFNEIIHGKGQIERHIDAALKLLGLKIRRNKINALSSDYGIMANQKDLQIIIAQMAPNSEAYKQGIAKDDIICAINGVNVISLDEANSLLNGEHLHDIEILRNGKQHQYSIKQKKEYFMNYALELDLNATPFAIRNFNKWAKTSRK